MKNLLPLLAIPMALASPSLMVKRTPPAHAEVVIEDLDSSWDLNCGKIVVKGEDVEKATSWGTNLFDNRQTLGVNQYPHDYRNRENFKFVSDKCDNIPSGASRLEFPIVKGGYFNGDNDDVYKFRAVFLRKPGENNCDGNAITYYCGTIYHTSSGDFEGCDIFRA